MRKEKVFNKAKLMMNRYYKLMKLILMQVNGKIINLLEEELANLENDLIYINIY